MTADSAQPIALVDTTLRDGEQMPGVAFSRRDKVNLACLLSDAGLVELEVGTPAMGAESIADIRAIVRCSLPSRVTAWCRATEGDLHAAAVAQVAAVHISFPASDLHLSMLGKSRPWLLEQIERLVTLACQMFDYVSVGAQDASRAQVELLIEGARAAQRAGAARIRLADTVGVWNPVAVRTTILAVREATEHIALGLHAHNDLGMATANTLAALEAGAESADVTVLGIGERAGNAALEEVVMALRHTLRCDAGVSCEKLMGLAESVARAARYRVAANKPVVGRNAFLHESGIHVQGLLQRATAYEPYSAGEVGRTSRMVLGTHSGSRAWCHALSRLGLRLPPAAVARLLPCLRRLADRRALRRLLQQWQIPLS